MKYIINSTLLLANAFIIGVETDDATESGPTHNMISRMITSVTRFLMIYAYNFTICKMNKSKVVSKNMYICLICFS